MAAPAKVMDAPFDEILLRISYPAFKWVVVDQGVRNLGAFLEIDGASLDKAKPNIAAEILSSQHLARDRLAVHASEPARPHLVAPEPEPQQASLREDTRIFLDETGLSLGKGDFREGEDFESFYQAVLDNLRTRSRNALEAYGVCTLQRFLQLKPEELLGFCNVGSRTWSEIRKLKHEVESFISARLRNGLPVSARGLQDRLAAQIRRRVLWSVATSVAHEIGDPEGWSVLRRTIPDMLGASADTLDDLWARCGEERLSALELPSEEWRKLSVIVIFPEDTLQTLLAVSTGYLIQADISQESFDRIVACIRRLVQGAREDEECSHDEYCLSDKPIHAGLASAPVAAFRLDSFDVPENQLEGLRALGISTWGQLGGVTERCLVDRFGMGSEALRAIEQIWRLKPWADKVTREVPGSPVEDSPTFEEVVRAVVNEVARDERGSNLVLGRLGIPDGRRRTLEELGQTYGLTREGVRQVAQRCVSRLRSKRQLDRLAKLWKAVEEELRVCGGVCFFEELAEGVSRRMAWSEGPNPLAFARFASLREGLAFDWKQHTVRDPLHRCSDCRQALSHLEEMFAQDKDDKPLAEVASSLLSACREQAKCSEAGRAASFSKALVCRLVGESVHLKVDDDFAYRRDMWSARRGSCVQLTESVLKEAGRPMHFREVHLELAKSNADILHLSEHNVYSWLERGDHVLRWGPGTFVHVDFVDVPTEFIKEVESWLIGRLAEDVPFVMVSAAYEEFKDNCRQHHITTEAGLYACLRKSGSPRLRYPRYPQVYLSGFYEDRVPVIVALEQFVRDAGGPVSLDVLREYAVGRLGLKEWLFTQRLVQATDVIRLGPRLYAHVDHVRIDASRLEPIVAYIRNFLAAEDHVSVARIFKGKQVSCTAIGIEHPQALYSLLRITHGEELELSNYPQIRLSDGTGTAGKGVIEEVAEYLRGKAGPCSYDELERRFVDELGYREQTVDGVACRSDVLRFSWGTLVHAFALYGVRIKVEAVPEPHARQILTRLAPGGRHFHREMLPELVVISYELAEVDDGKGFNELQSREINDRIGGGQVDPRAKLVYVVKREFHKKVSRARHVERVRALIASR